MATFLFLINSLVPSCIALTRARKNTSGNIGYCNVQLQRLVYTSTSTVVLGKDRTPRFSDESHPYPDDHLDIYTETKAKAEKLVVAANGRNGLATCTLRPRSCQNGTPQLDIYWKRGSYY